MKKGDRKVVFFTYLPLEYGGGVAKFLIDTAAALRADSSISPVIVTLTPRFARRVLQLYSLYFFGKQDMQIGNKEGAAAVRKRLGGRPTYVQADSLHELKQIFHTTDAIYMNNNILELFLIDCLIGLRTLPPVIIGFHTPSIYPMARSFHSKLHNVLYGSRLYRSLVSKAARLHVVNGFDHALYTKSFPEADVRSIPYRFDSAATRHKTRSQIVTLPPRTKRIRIAWIGRLTAQKGIAGLCALVDAMNKADGGHEFEFIIAGEGELRDDILTLQSRYTNVQYLGYVQNSHIPSLLSRCDAYLNTSLWETYPYTVLESLSVGIPVFAYDIPGIRDMIVSGKTGMLYRNADAMEKNLLSDLRSTQFERTAIKSHLSRMLDNRRIYKDMISLLSV